MNTCAFHGALGKSASKSVINLRATFLSAALIAGIAQSAGSHAADCDQPDRPQLPDGASATMQDMLDGQKAVKAFQTANVEYMKCLEKTFTKAEKAVKKARNDEKRAAAEALHNDSVAAYNAAVSAEEEVAGAFNIQIREYKAANQ
ncbi:MAG: hypothetical protein Cons2KO_02500 [Congregibacter sp.]